MRKNLCFILDELINNVNELIRLEKGDLGRLTHIKDTLQQNKTLYESDKEYLEKLSKQYLNDKPNVNETHYDQSNSNLFCFKCGQNLKLDSSFCPKCGTPQEKQQSESHVNPNITSESNHIVQNKNKPKKGLIFLGIAFILIASGAFVIPINDMGLTTADISSLCKSPLGMMGQAFGGETAVNNCASYNILTTIAILLGIFGLILIVIGIVKKNDFSPKTKIIAVAVILSIIIFIGFSIVLPFPYGLFGSIIAPILIIIITKKKLQKIR
jgi:hypothetical protein